MITIQSGNYSNYVGAHLFNLQLKSQEAPEATCTIPSSLWRQPSSKALPTPRTVIFDTKDNVGFHNNPSKHAKQVPTGGDDPASSFRLWDGKVENYTEEMDEEKGERKWSDLPQWRQDPEALHIIPNFSHNSEQGGISTYGQGAEIWSKMEQGGEESIRKYAEECDRVEGFLVLVDQFEGYSGLSAGILSHLADDYEKKLCIGVGLCPYTSGRAEVKDFRRRIANTTLLWNAFNSHSSLFTSMGVCQDFCQAEMSPVELSNLSYSPQSVYESSAVLASVLDNFISPTYTFSGNSSSGLREIASFLSAMGRKFTSVSGTFPFPLDFQGSSTLFRTLNNSGLDSLRYLTQGMEGSTVDLEGSTGNYCSIRGIPSSYVISANERKSLLRQHSDIKDAQSCLALYVQETFPSSVNLVQGFDFPVTITHPFPSTIVNQYAKERFSSGHQYSQGSISSWSFSSVTCAHNTNKIGTIIDNVLVEANGTGGKRNVNRITRPSHSSSELGMDVDDFAEALNSLEELRNRYDAT